MSDHEEQERHLVKPTAPGDTIDIVKAGLKRRHAEERRFRFYGKLAIGAGLLFLTLLFTRHCRQWLQRLPADLHPTWRLTSIQGAGPAGQRAIPRLLEPADYGGLIKQAMRDAVSSSHSGRVDTRALYALVSSGACFRIARHGAGQSRHHRYPASLAGCWR